MVCFNLASKPDNHETDKFKDLVAEYSHLFRLPEAQARRGSGIGGPHPDVGGARLEVHHVWPAGVDGRIRFAKA